jgi:hypothetical protein
MISSLLENLTQSPTTSPENEDDMWRWMIKQYGKGAASVDSIDKTVSFIQSQVIPLFRKMYNVFVPQLNTLKDIFQVPTNTSTTNSTTTPTATTTPTTTPTATTTPTTTTPTTTTTPATTPENVQTGGGCQFYSKEFYQYRLNTYQNMMNFLQKHNINLQPITKRVIEHLLLRNYSIDYIKSLNHVLFYLNQVENLSVNKKKEIQIIFDKLALDIQRNMLN